MQTAVSQSTTPEKDENDDSTFRNNLPSIYNNENDIFAFNNPLPTPIFVPKPPTSTSTTTTSPSPPPPAPTTTTSTQLPPGIFPHFMQSSYDSPSSSSSSNEQRFRFQETEFMDSAVSNNLCLDGTFDAITLLSDGYTYVFKDAYVYKFDNNFALDKEFPRLINSVFKVIFLF